MEASWRQSTAASEIETADGDRRAVTEKIRLIVADDYPVVRQGFRCMLSPSGDIEIVGEASDGEGVVKLAAELLPDAILLDLCLSGGDSTYLIPMLREVAPQARVLVVATYDDAEHLASALRHGASGYLLKSVSSQELTDAIRRVHSGRQVLSDELVDPLIRQFQALSREYTQRISGLTPSELKILSLVASGASTSEIAQSQHWSEITVKRKIAGILAKLGATTRAHAVAQAMRRGLI